jgi:secreted trypsin-like serine protease
LYLTQESKNYSLTVKQIKVPVWNMKKCESALRRLFGFNLPSMNSILCAGSFLKDGCIGDGGSPLICSGILNDSRFYQLGIVSFGIGCGRIDTPGVYSSLIGDKINWIRNNLK